MRRQSICIILKEFDNVSIFLSCTECEDMVVSQDNHALCLLRWALLLSQVLIVLNVDFTALWLHLRFVLSSVFTPALSSLLPS